MGTFINMNDSIGLTERGGSLVLEHESGFVRGIPFGIIKKWWWNPDKPLPEKQKVADN